MLDSTSFLAINPRTGTPSLAFNVLGAYGYPAQDRPRLWALHASHHACQQEWEALPSPSFPVPYVARCEHHLRDNAVEALHDDRVDH